jgi:uncharacterized lipoprotein YehR (DUF1307 family)
MKHLTFSVVALAVLLSACTQEQQNKISRDIQNWTGTNGVMEVYAGEKLVRQIRADIETRYASTSITQKQLGIAAGEFTDLPDAIFKHLNTKAQLAPYLTNSRHKTPNRRLIIYLAVERYAWILPPLALP